MCAGTGPRPPVLVAEIAPPPFPCPPCCPVWLGVIPGLAAWLAAKVAARKDVDRGWRRGVGDEIGTVNDPPALLLPPPIRVRLMAGSDEDTIPDDGDEPKSPADVSAATAAGAFLPRLRLRLLLLLLAAVDCWPGDTGRNRLDPARPPERVPALLTDASREDAAAEVAARRALVAWVFEIVLSREGETEGSRPCRCLGGGRCCCCCSCRELASASAFFCRPNASEAPRRAAAVAAALSEAASDPVVPPMMAASRKGNEFDPGLEDCGPLNLSRRLGQETRWAEHVCRRIRKGGAKRGRRVVLCRQMRIEGTEGDRSGVASKKR